MKKLFATIEKDLRDYSDEKIKLLDKELVKILDAAAQHYKKDLEIRFGHGTYLVLAGKEHIQLIKKFDDKINDLDTFAQDTLKNYLTDYKSYYN